VGFGYYVLIDLQLSMGRTRKRLDDIQAEDSKFFSPEERKVLKFEPYKHPSLRNLPTLIILMGTAAFGALLVGYARGGLFRAPCPSTGSSTATTIKSQSSSNLGLHTSMSY
jgi:hypothetical protein